MNSYTGFYKGQEVDVEALTSYKAQIAIAKQLKVSDKNRYQIVVFLTAKDGVPVCHSTTALGA